MEYKILNGQPKDASMRAEKERAVYSLLASLGIAYQHITFGEKE